MRLCFRWERQPHNSQPTHNSRSVMVHCWCASGGTDSLTTVTMQLVYLDACTKEVMRLHLNGHIAIPLTTHVL